MTDKSSSRLNQSECVVCGGPIPDDYDKFDDDAPVHAEGFVYHLGCEDGVFEQVYEEVDFS